MKENLGWLALLIGLGGATLLSYIEYASQVGGSSGEDTGGLLAVLNCLCWAAGLGALGFRTFQTMASKVVGMIVYSVVMPVAMVAINIGINGFHIRVM